MTLPLQIYLYKFEALFLKHKHHHKFVIHDDLLLKIYCNSKLLSDINDS